eukprot:PITA_07084
MEKKPSGLIILISILLIMVIKVHGADTELDFAYEGARGPSHWGDLKEEWRTCDNGKEQSPIDLVMKNIEIFPSLGKLQKSYRAANASLKNRGHDIMVRWAEGAGTIRIDGTSFTLVQCHWHSPAEHTINGKRYPLEIHMVHKSVDNQTVVIGILYKYGRHDTFLAELMNKMASLSHEMEAGAEEALGVIDPKHIKLGSRKYYRYIGSLTTPPCTEGVIWIIVKKVRTVSRDEVREIIGAIHDGYGKNARPTQPANGRSIEMYTPRRIPRHL